MSAPTVASYRFGEIIITGQAFCSDVIILPDRVLSGWRRLEGHVLRPEDLADVFERAPQTLIVGLGAHSRMRIPPETQLALEQAGIRLLALPTEQACQEYNRLQSSNPGSAAAALHLTC